MAAAFGPEGGLPLLGGRWGVLAAGGSGGAGRYRGVGVTVVKGAGTMR
jgi:hypothetical protein